MKQTFNGISYNAFKGFLYGIVIYAIILFGSLWLALTLKIMMLFMAGFILPGLVALLFQQTIKNYFTKKITIHFDDTGFDMLFKTVKDEKPAGALSFRWSAIKGYKFYFTPTGLTYLDLYFRKQRFREFAFKDGGQSGSEKEGSIFTLFRNRIKNYNASVADTEQIQLRPGFLTTAGGNWILLGLGILILLATILHVALGHPFTPAYFIGLLFYVPLLAKRKSDKVLYEKMKSDT